MSQKHGQMTLPGVIATSSAGKVDEVRGPNSTGSSTKVHLSPSAADQWREQLIADAQQRLLGARTEQDRRDAARWIAKLVAGRSLAQVARMERAKGLRK